MKKPIYILGINGSHCATAALLKNGEIIACASEERFTRIKNQRGYPRKAIEYCLREANITSKDLESVYIGFEDPTLFIGDKEFKRNSYISFLRKNLITIDKVFWRIVPGYQGFNRFYAKRRKSFSFIGFEKKENDFLHSVLKIPAEKIHTMDHHTAHAFAAYYSSPLYMDKRNEPALAVTVDGTGDGVSSKVFLVKNFKWNEIGQTVDAQSLGWLYACVTNYLGMKVNEHEYKVMGLAPYARKDAVLKIYKLLSKHMWVKGLAIYSDIPLISYSKFIEDNFRGIRFDSIAGAIQMLTENLLKLLVENAVKQTKVKYVTLGGGVMMNIKANMEIGKLSNVEDVFPMPSAGDESTAIGSAYYGYKDYCDKNKINFNPKPLSNLYLGPVYNIKCSTRQIIISEKSTKRRKVSSISLNDLKKKGIVIRQLQHPEKTIAQLLAEGKVVARFAGRMEFGARALGNRSILANPADYGVIRVINEQIKSRDFWMPFAPTILSERSKDYIINPKAFIAPYMTLGFETTALAREHLKAAVHQYDFTVRPQILERTQNESYYDTIHEFELLTGIGAVLNTSFNIHGEPVVCSPQDAISTFLRSGLKHLILESYLFEKP